MKALVRSLVGFSLVGLCVAGLAIMFGGPGQPAPMSGINSPFKEIKYSDLPAVKYFASRDGSKLAFRGYRANDEAFHAERFAEVFRTAGRPVPVTIIPKIGHIALTLNSVAIQAAVSAVTRLNEGSHIGVS